MTPPRRRGFTVLEVIIAILLIAIMSAAVIPALMGRIRDAQTSALSQTLFSLSLAIFEYRKAVTVYPPQLVHLATKPASTVTDACGVTAIGVPNSNNWRGPYVSRELVTGGIGIGDAQINNQLRREPGPPVVLYMDVAAVDNTTTIDIETSYDGPITGASPTTGTIRYTTGTVGSLPAAPPQTYNLSYGIPITGC